MKEYLRQFYNEGLGKLLYLNPVNYIKKRIKNKTLLKILDIIFKVIYTLIALLLVLNYLIYKLK